MTSTHIATRPTTHRPAAVARDRIGMHPLVAVLAAGAIVLELVRIANLFLSVFEGGRLVALGVLTLLVHFVTCSMVMVLIQWSRPRR